MGRKLKSSKWPGVLFREHASRKHGLQFDKYFIIYYRWNSKNYQEALGWASQGWTGLKAAAVLGELKENQRRGEGPKSLAEKRAKDNEQTAIKKNQNITFGRFFMETYLPAQDCKSAQALRREKSFYNVWLDQSIAAHTFDEISELMIEKLKRDILKVGRSARTVEYCLAVTRQTWNLALRRGVTDKPWPGRYVKRPKADNRRTAFFSQEQAQTLLEQLAKKSTQWRDITLLSLHTGLRAGEIFRLQWEDIDLLNKTLHIRDPKSRRDRFVYMTDEVFEMLTLRRSGKEAGFVFTDRHGRAIREVSQTIQRAIDALGFNEGINDRRHKLTFHSCRHTFASWAASAGVDMFTLQRMLGHETAAMTQRYSHLAPSGIRSAMRKLDGTLSRKVKAGVVPIRRA